MSPKDKKEKAKYDKSYYERNKEKIKKKVLEWKHDHRDEYNSIKCQQYTNRRLKFISMYGGKCACCGETTMEFLSLDHIDPKTKLRANGKKENTPMALGRAIKEYRPNEFQILCHNCNQAKGYYGVCPHQLKKESV